MNPAKTHPGSSASRDVTSVCDRFRSAWGTANSLESRPRIQDFLRVIPESERNAALRSLLTVELEFRRGAGEKPTVADYTSQIPDYVSVVQSVFQSTEVGDNEHSDRLTVDYNPGGATKLGIGSILGTLGHSQPGSVPTTQLSGDVASGTVPRMPEIPGYEVIEELGKGGMGIVYKARDVHLQRWVALKMILPSRDESPKLLGRFFAEAAVVAKFQHPNLVQIYEIAEYGGQPYFSLELLEGGNLHKKLAGTPQPAKESAALVETLARALEYAHRKGVVHRDLKPTNILLTMDGTPKIADFGLAKQMDQDVNPTEDGGIIGTPAYMAPEQAWGNAENVGVGADIYALGVILYEMLTGRPPLKAADKWQTIKLVRSQDPLPPSQLVPQVPRDLEIICLKCLKKEIPERFVSATALADELRRFLDGRPIQTRPAPLWEQAWKWSRRQPALASLIAVSIAALISLVLYLDQRARVATRELAEQTRTIDLRGKVQTLQIQAQDAADRGQLKDAQGSLQAAAEIIRLEPALVDLNGPLEVTRKEIALKLLDQQGEHAAQLVYESLFKHRDEALFHGMVYTGLDSSSNSGLARKACEAGFAILGVTVDPAEGPVFTKYMTPQRQQQCTAVCYELLLVGADAEIQAEAGQPAPKKSQVEKALKILDRAARLNVPRTGAFHIRRAAYLELLGSADQAARERSLAPGAHSQDALDQFLTGVSLQNSGKLAEAAQAFVNALVSQPDHFWAQYHLAVCHLQLQRPAQARDNLTACVSAKRDFVWLYLLRGLANGQLKDYQAAEDDFARAIALKPDARAQVGILVNRAALRLQQIRPVDHWPAAPWLLSQVPNFEFLARGAIEAWRGERLASASAFLEKAIALDASQHQAFRYQAIVAQKQKRYVDATAALAHAMKAVGGRDPQAQADLWALKARLSRECQDFDAAIEEFGHALRLFPRGDDHFERGQIYFARKKHANALIDFEAALRWKFAEPEVLRGKAECLIALQRDRDAIGAYDQYIASLPRPTAEAFRARGLVRSRLQQFPEALADYTQSLNLKPDSATHTIRGWVFLANSVVPLALQDFDAAIKLDPKNGEAYTGRGLIHAKLGQADHAISDAGLAINQARSATPRLYWNITHIYAQLAAHLTTEKGSKVPSAGVKYDLYQKLAIETLQLALERVPPNERIVFWNKFIASDALLDSLRGHSGFERLEREFGIAREPAVDAKNAANGRSE